MSDEKLEIKDAVSLLSKDSEHIEEEIKSRDLSIEALDELHDAEESGDKRKDVLQIFEREIKHRKVSDELSAAKEDVKELESALEKVKQIEGVETHKDGFEDLESDDIIDLMAGDIENMREFLQKHRPDEPSLNKLLEAEKKINSREEAIELIQDTIERENLEVDIAEAEEDIENLEESVERLQKSSKIADPPNEDEEADNDEEEETEDSEEDETDEEKDSNTETEEQDEDAADEEKSDKEKLADELDLELSEEELDSTSIEYLQQVKEEKEKRNRIIESLKEQGMDEEDLKQASTSDLEKIKEELIEEKEEESSEDPDKSKEEIEKEAEEDLKMLMGAGKSKEDTQEKDTGKGRIAGIKDKLSSKFSSSDEEESDDDGALDDVKLKEVLQEYQDLQNKEAVIKTAHITKGYLERELEIERELTYRELSEEMPKDTESLETLSDMFKTLNREQYTQDISLDSDNFIDTCRSAVDELKG